MSQGAKQFAQRAIIEIAIAITLIIYFVLELIFLPWATPFCYHDVRNILLILLGCWTLTSAFSLLIHACYHTLRAEQLLNDDINSDFNMDYLQIVVCCILGVSGAVFSLMALPEMLAYSPEPVTCLIKTWTASWLPVFIWISVGSILVILISISGWIFSSWLCGTLWAALSSFGGEYSKQINTSDISENNKNFIQIAAHHV